VAGPERQASRTSPRAQAIASGTLAVGIVGITPRAPLRFSLRLRGSCRGGGAGLRLVQLSRQRSDELRLAGIAERRADHLRVVGPQRFAELVEGRLLQQQEERRGPGLQRLPDLSD